MSTGNRYDTYPVEEHDEEEHGEEVVRVEEDLVLGPTHFIGGRRVDDKHSEGHDSPGQVSSTLDPPYIHVNTYCM